MSIEQKKVSILEIANGALKEEVEIQLGRLVENILDLNTNYKTARSMTIKLEFKTDEQRTVTKVEATTSVKLASSKPVVTQLVFDVDGEDKMAIELSKNIPGQMDVYGNEEPVNKIFAIK